MGSQAGLPATVRTCTDTHSVHTIRTVFNTDKAERGAALRHLLEGPSLECNTMYLSHTNCILQHKAHWKGPAWKGARISNVWKRVSSKSENSERRRLMSFMT